MDQYEALDRFNGKIIAGVVRRLRKKKYPLVALDPRKIDPTEPSGWFAARGLQPVGILVMNWWPGWQFDFVPTPECPSIGGPGDELWEALNEIRDQLVDHFRDCSDEEWNITDEEGFERALDQFYREQLDPPFEDHPLDHPLIDV